MDIYSKSWVGVYAHPDDEWVAGWPVFQSHGLLKGVVFFVGNNGYCGDPTWEDKLSRLLLSFGIKYLGTLNLHPDFYMASRHEKAQISDKLTDLLLMKCVNEFSGAALITHNPVGEYGHPDHVQVLNTLLQGSSHNEIYITDLCYDVNLSGKQKDIFYNKPVTEVIELDIALWNLAVNRYKTDLKWTGKSLPGQTKVKLYSL